MIKQVSPYMWDYGEDPVSLVKVSSHGLVGNDLKSFVKRAGDEAAHRLKLIVKDLPKDEDYVHMLAMGASEIISPNKNGDGWKEAILKSSYHTFVKFGFYHRNHKVEETEGVYGKIRDAWYNQKMGRVELITGFFTTKEAAQRGHAKRGRVADKELQILNSGADLPVSMSGFVPYDSCFKAGTLVDTEFGLRPIETLKVGEYVRSHTGELRKITRVLKRAYSGTMVDIKVMGVPEVITATAEHPFLLVRKADLRSCHGVVKNRNGKREKRRHSFSNNESCAGCQKTVEIQREWVDAQSIHVGDFATCPMLLPGDWKIGSSKAYLLGLYTGDGSIIKKTRTREKLVEDVAAGLSFSLDDKWPAVKVAALAHAKAVTGFDHNLYPAGDGKKSHSLTLYESDFSTDAQFLIGNGSGEKLLSEEIFNLCREDRLAFLAGWVDSDGCVDFLHRPGTVRISSINRSLMEQCKRLIAGLGFNASVGEFAVSGGFKNSVAKAYTVSSGRDLWNALAHYSAKINGQLCESRSLTATVTKDNYTHMPIQETKHYYEECDVFNLSVEIDETYIVSGVVVHNCSGCGHKAAHRKDYCDARICKYGGLKRNIGKVFEDGVHLHADNPDTKFFDISGIYNEQTLSPERQADRIAYSLGRLKAASVSDFERLEPQVLPLPILAGINEWVGKQANLLSSMREIEAANSGLTYFGSAAEGYQFGPDIFSPVSMHSLNKLAKEGICLSLEDFAKACGTPGLAAAAKPYAKTALQTLSESEYLPDLLENNPFKFKEVFSTPDSRKALFLMTPEAVRKRAWLNGAVETSTETDTPVESQAAEELANLHALYRLGFCASFPKSSNLLLLSSYIARHNL